MYSTPTSTSPRWAACLLLCAAALPAHAAFTNPLTATLSAPGGIIGNSAPISLVNTPVNPSVGIAVGDGTPIGNFMLPNEAISFSAGNSITLRIAAGGVNTSGQLVTGFLGLGGSPAVYSFTNLAVAGNFLTGFTGSLAGLTSPNNLNSIVTFTAPSTLTVRLDNLVLTPVPGGGQSDALATITINMQTAPIPEPASWALLLAGGAALLGWRRAVSARR